jgi:23S rRNA (uridine2552-2'-O)-methyltransferase
VLDVGAWPGGWMQVALEQVGSTGRVVGVDLARIDPLGAPNARVLTLDVRGAATWPLVLEALGQPADVVLCDLAPKLTGVRDRDEAAGAELIDALLTGVGTTLRRGGRLLVKLFMGGDFQEQIRRLTDRFETVHRTRPEATRRGSSEIYAVGLGYLGT